VRSGRIFDLKRFAIHDGPGIRTTVFFKGCPLSCPWCHNPEGRSPDRELFLRSTRCTSCGACLSACPVGALRRTDGTVEVDRARCVVTGNCAAACPTGALEIVGREVTVSGLLSTLERDRPFYDSSGGGVSVSGGEPLAQADFLIELLAACRDRRLRTTVDTSGYAPREVVDEVVGLADLFLYDLKLIDPVAHRRLTGVDNEPILENLRALASRGAAVVVRIPVVPGLTDALDNIEGIARFVASSGIRYPVDLLPYHRAGVDKFARLGIACDVESTEVPTDETMARLASVFREYKLHVMVGGRPYGED